MATHSSILAWRILWMEGPGGLLSTGSHRVGHDWSNLAGMHALEKAMATHSSILAWRIPETEEPGRLPSMGTHRVGHDWSNLAAAAAAAVWLVCVLACFSLGLSSMGLFVPIALDWLFHVGEIFNCNLFKNFLIPFLFLFFFWDPYNSNVGVFDIVSEFSETILSSFHSFCFILLFRSYFHQFIFQFTVLFFCFRYSAIDSL